MTRLPGEIFYRVLVNGEDLSRIYSIMREQRLLWAAWPEIAVDEWSEELFSKKLSLPGMYVIEGYINSNPAGLMLLWPFMPLTLCAEIGVSAYRPYFRFAKELFLGALMFALTSLTPAPVSFIGRIAAPNRHIFNMYSSVGFQLLGNVPGMMWYARLKRFVDAALVLATPGTIESARRQL